MGYNKKLLFGALVKTDGMNHVDLEFFPIRVRSSYVGTQLGFAVEMVVAWLVATVGLLMIEGLIQYKGWLSRLHTDLEFIVHCNQLIPLGPYSKTGQR